jgi:putative acetyltransferase
MIVIRPYKADDAAATAQVFLEAVREGTADYYTEEQRFAWARFLPETQGWDQRLSGQICYVADDNGAMAGFMTMTTEGYFDLAFVHPDHIGTGLGTRLYERLEADARSLRLESLSTEASLMARPFFEKHGWRVVMDQTIVRHGVELRNFKMKKTV